MLTLTTNACWNPWPETTPPQRLRQRVDEAMDGHSLMRVAVLNALAIMVPLEASQTWIRDEPDIFSKALPVIRDRAAQRQHPQAAARRLRTRT